MNAQQKHEDKQKVGRWQKVLLATYVFLMVFLVFMFGARFTSMVARRQFRKETNTYPDSCSDWALNDGCTRMAMS